MTIGDGSFMYNPVVPAIAFADEHKLPLLILVFNNAKYAAMQYFHDKFYPAGAAIATKDYYGVNIKGLKYEETAAMVGGYGKRGEDTNPACFGGCCNPMNLRACAGDILTAESEGVIKSFSATGEFRAQSRKARRNRAGLGEVFENLIGLVHGCSLKIGSGEPIPCPAASQA